MQLNFFWDEPIFDISFFRNKYRIAATDMLFSISLLMEAGLCRVMRPDLRDGRFMWRLDNVGSIDDVAVVGPQKAFQFLRVLFVTSLDNTFHLNLKDIGL